MYVQFGQCCPFVAQTEAKWIVATAKECVYHVYCRLHVSQMPKRWDIGETSLFTQFACSSAIECQFYAAMASHFLPKLFTGSQLVQRTFCRLYSNKQKLWPHRHAHYGHCVRYATTEFPMNRLFNIQTPFNSCVSKKPCTQLNWLDWEGDSFEHEKKMISYLIQFTYIFSWRKTFEFINFIKNAAVGKIVNRLLTNSLTKNRYLNESSQFQQLSWPQNTRHSSIYSEIAAR